MAVLNEWDRQLARERAKRAAISVGPSGSQVGKRHEAVEKAWRSRKRHSLLHVAKAINDFGVPSGRKDATNYSRADLIGSPESADFELQ